MLTYLGKNGCYKLTCDVALRAVSIDVSYEEQLWFGSVLHWEASHRATTYLRGYFGALLLLVGG